MRKLICFLMATIMFVACGKDDFSFKVKEEIKNPYAVTPEEAVQLLQTVIGDETTRSVSISDIQTLTKGNFTQTTRSGADDEVIYIVDIEGGGSAIMGADKRMEPIYAVLDNTKITAEQLVGATTRSESEGDDIEDYVLGLLNNAILSDIQEVETAGVEMPLIPRDQTWSVTTVIAEQEAFLDTQWHQESPYNDNYPVHSITGRKYPAGCGIIALAQILYFHRFPSSLNGITFDWTLLSWNEVGYYPPTSATIEVANFVWSIKTAIDNYSEVQYDYDSETDKLRTETTEYQAKYLLETAGYEDVTIATYNLNSIIDMVANENIPVYVQGYDEEEEVGHAWVIDGCDIHKIDYWVRHYTDAINYTEYIDGTSHINLVHCNFGWTNGICNGDYNSGIFNTTEGNYSANKKIITYSKN